EVIERAMPFDGDDIRRDGGRTDVLRVLAARMEEASARRRKEARWTARNRFEAMLLSLHARERTEEPLRVRMERLMEQVLRRGLLDNLPRVHHRDPVGHFRHRRYVVRNDDQRHAERL